MNITDNKKAQTFDGKGFIGVNNFRKVNMTTIQQNLLNPNKQPLIIGEFSIRQDEDGRYSLADLHKASGNLAKHKPSNFLRVEQSKELISEIEQFSDMRSAVKVINGGNQRGTYAVKEMVYAYAMWISAKFHLMVIRAYDSLVMEWMIGGKQTISPEQAGILYNIVHTRASGNGGTIANMWSRLKNHFKYSASYRELRAIHFDDAKHYLEMMEIKPKAEKQKAQTDKIEVEKHYHDNVHGLALHMIWVNRWWKEFGDAIRMISPQMAGAVNHHFSDGVCFAYHFVDQPTRLEIDDKLKYYSWHLSYAERMALDYKR